MDLKNRYDESNPHSIEKYSKGLINKTFANILSDYFIGDESEGYKSEYDRYNSPRRKGSLGNLVEKYYFGYEPNSSPEPDFPLAGVELKVTPYEKTKTGKYRAGERLVLGMIPNSKPVPEVFTDSIAYKNLKLVLLVLYFRDISLERMEYSINYSQLVSIDYEELKRDYEIIKSDYEIIIGKIRSGNAHKLSESDTMYLGAATKGSTAKKSLQSQYYNDRIPAKRRAFSLKQGYMTSFINDYIIKNKPTYDRIIDAAVSKEKFEKLVIGKLRQYKGFSEKQLRKEFNLEDSTSKDIFSIFTFKMLGVKTTNAEEFDKSNTEVKSIRIEEDGKIKESMSFPTIKFSEFVDEKWENSNVYNYFSETRFLFVLYIKKDGQYLLNDAFFWNLPFEDLDNQGKEDWLRSQKVIKEGVVFNIKGSRVFNSIPDSKTTNIFHLRPKAQKSAYRIASLNYEKGNISRDSDRLPNGDYMTKQCFWLNKDYISKQIAKKDETP